MFYFLFIVVEKNLIKNIKKSVKIVVILLVVGYLSMMFFASFIIVFWYVPLIYIGLVGLLSVPFALGAAFLIKELVDRKISYLLWWGGFYG